MSETLTESHEARSNGASGIPTAEELGFDPDELREKYRKERDKLRAS